MKYKVCDKHESMVSPHTNKNYLNTVNFWGDEEKVNVYHLLLEANNATVEGEVIFIQFEGKDVDIKKYKYNV